VEPRLFGTNGIRGVVNQDLTPEFVIKVGQAIGTFFKGGRLLIGCDGRSSSPLFKDATISGLTSTGCTVYDVGYAPTPAIQFLTKHFGLDGSVIITASHNPPEYNGIKVNWKDGVEIPREDEIKIEQKYFNETFKRASWKNLGKNYETEDVLGIYLEAVKRQVTVDLIKAKHYRVVVDPGNGVGTLTTPYLLRDLECEVITINADLDGSFPGRLPEPAIQNLSELARVVKAVGADFGVAHDGDGDRSVFVDETGEIHWGDRSFALIEKHFLKQHPNEQIVTPVSSSQVVSDLARKYGGKIVWTKVGSIIVSRTMLEVGAKLGGEENGGVFYAPHQAVRDGAMATALILQILAKTGKELSKLLGELPKYRQHKDKVACPNELKEKVLEKIRKITEKFRVEAIDGVKIWFPDKSWILIRPSGTEPIYRLFAEAKTQQKAIQRVEEYKKIVTELVESVKPC